MKILFWMFIGFDRHATSEHLLLSVIERLCEEGCSVHILQKDTGGDLPSIPEKLTKYDVTTDVFPVRAADRGNFVSRYLTELIYIRDCRKALVPGYDAVFIQSTTAAGFAVRAVRKKLPGALLTLNVQDIFPCNLAYCGRLKKTSPVYKILAAEQRFGYKHADHIITISEDMKDTLTAEGVPEGRVEVVYNWSYQDDLYRNVDLSPVSHMFSPFFFNVVYAGNIGLMQNVDILLDAAELMKEERDVRFHIIGSGVCKERLEAEAKERGLLNISFWPMQEPELAPAVYSAADVNVIPLVRGVYRTALPSKTATCLACQKPVVLAIGKESRFGKKARDEAGCILVDAERAEELAEALRRVRKGDGKGRSGEFFMKYCALTRNSRKYSDIITGRSAR